MISEKCVNEYCNIYTDDVCFFADPGEFLIIDNGEQCFSEPDGETNKTFMDRLERSKKTGQNLFYEEWESFEYEEGADY